MQQTGLYEQLITNLIAEHLDDERYYVGERTLEPADASVWLARFLAGILKVALDNIDKNVDNGDDQLSAQIELSNQLLLWLKQQLRNNDFIEQNLLHSQGRILPALFERENPIASSLPDHVKDIFPLTGLSQSELFCGSNAGISLETELKREILSADSICWLVSFIKWTGLRIFRKELEQFTQAGKSLRVITTSYMGATDAKAIEFLARLNNTEVKVSYNTRQERLHAKSYLFHRNTGFNTGYIGSSNLSHSALTNGLEWNLKITSQEIPHVIEKCASTFETYWQSNEFETFTGQLPCVNKLRKALSQQTIQLQGARFYFDIQPQVHQKQILDKLSVERDVHQRFRNLVVAATGTGNTNSINSLITLLVKTVIDCVINLAGSLLPDFA